ncbi:MAG: ABC transporter substrate-binding protein [Acidimicrobiia bacterium]
MNRIERALALGLVAALVFAACGGGGSSGGGSSADNLPACPLSALTKATKPVEITFWHALTRANEQVLQQLTDRFNSTQTEVKVKLVNQIGYKENLEKYRAGLGGTDLPDVLQVEDTATQQMIDTQSILPAQSCIKADHYDTSDYVKRVLDRYTVDKVLWPMPFNVSNPVFFYDKNAFRAAGLDPEKPPKTLDEVKADAVKIKDLPQYEAGFGLKLDPWYLEQWSAKADKLYVNQENGRKTRATKTLFDNATGLDIFSWMDDMVKSGAAKTNSADGPSAFDNLLGIRSKTVGMSIDTSATLGTISQVFSQGESGGVELGVAPMPGPPGAGGVLVGGGALYIVKKSAPEKQAAVWKYLKFLDDPQTQADFAAGTGYVPIRKSSVDLPAIQQQWAREPGYKVAYDQLISGKDDIATQGPVIGAYQAVRDAVLAGEQEMFTQGKSPANALKSAASQSDTAMQEYNSRVGG